MEAAELKPLVLGLLEQVAGLKELVREQSEEIARLKGLKGKPDIKPEAKKKPSGMENGTDPTDANPKEPDKRKRSKKNFRIPVQDRIVKAHDVPAGSRNLGYEDFMVEDIILHAIAIRYRRERWLTPDGRTVIAALPMGVTDHVGAELKRFILMLYHQGQTTVPRLVALLDSMGLDVSERKIVRILTEEVERFKAEAQAVLRAAFQKAASWISVDDTGARHKGKNGICTQIGNHLFTFFATPHSKSRINFLSLLRAGHTDYVLNDAAFEYMKDHNMPSWVSDKLQEHHPRIFANEAAWLAHLEEIGLTKIRVHPNPVQIATEGALWGSILSHGFLKDSVILSDDAGQFNVGDAHALCWVHAERLVYKLKFFTDAGRAAQEKVRREIWDFYRALKAYKTKPAEEDKKRLAKRFDQIFDQKTGICAIDKLLNRLRRNKPELLRALERPDIPLHTNGSENDIRCQVTRRKISGTTRSDKGRDSRDAFLSLAKTCMKLDISFWDYLGDRLGILPHGSVPQLAALIAAHP